MAAKSKVKFWSLESWERDERGEWILSYAVQQQQKRPIVAMLTSPQLCCYEEFLFNLYCQCIASCLKGGFLKPLETHLPTPLCTHKPTHTITTKAYALSIQDIGQNLELNETSCWSDHVASAYKQSHHSYYTSGFHNTYMYVSSSLPMNKAIIHTTRLAFIIPTCMYHLPYLQTKPPFILHVWLS